MPSWSCLCAVACFASVSCIAFDTNHSLFHQISVDLAPYAAGVDKSMVDSMYCSSRDPGFRVQIKNQDIYIAGEVRGFQSRNRNIKLALLEVARTFQNLSDVDFVLGSNDFSASSGVGGPMFAQVLHRFPHACLVSICCFALSLLTQLARCIIQHTE